MRIRRKVMLLKQSGLSYREVGKKYGCSAQYIQEIVRLGIEGFVPEKCELCGGLNRLHIHHESYVPERIQVLCVSCHMKKHRMASVTIENT